MRKKVPVPHILTVRKRDAANGGVPLERVESLANAVVVHQRDKLLSLSRKVVKREWEKRIQAAADSQKNRNYNGRKSKTPQVHTGKYMTQLALYQP
jgi:hypothetical protein